MVIAADDFREVPSALESRDAFLGAMARQATSVAVITVAHGSHVLGVTVSSLVSVSADPPTILVSLCRESRLLAPILETRQFGISMLADDQEAIARGCASPERGPVPATAIRLAANGVPLLVGAAATLALALAEYVPVADHVLLLGRVRAAETSDKTPLVYQGRRYRRLSPHP